MKSTSQRMRVAAAMIIALTAASFADVTLAQTNNDPADYPATHADKKAAKEQAKADKKAAVAQAKADRKKTQAQADADKEKADAKVKDAEDQ